ncbi:ATP-binding cassette domain-containing protein [Stenotrophomonas maltophilia]|nr:ATP-binding cassette domain-containing protein [Stenotrophomonas maltophilia]
MRLFARVSELDAIPDDQLFAGSIADNISGFDSGFDEQRIEETARMAAVHDDIAGLPMAYHGLIGDMGNSLSGGQKQRVILARALYRRPRILFLHEAASHLDVMRGRWHGAATAPARQYPHDQPYPPVAATRPAQRCRAVALTAG